MAEQLSGTAFEWSRWRGWVVLYKRTSLKPIWGICLFLSGYIVFNAVVLSVLMLVLGPPEKQLPGPGWLVLMAGIAIVFLMAFLKVYRAEKGFLLPCFAWRIGKGTQLSIETRRIPQPTGMGGTLPGAPTRWLTLKRGGKKPKHFAKVFRDVDLLKINCAMAGSGASDKPVSK